MCVYIYICIYIYIPYMHTYMYEFGIPACLTLYVCDIYIYVHV